MDRRELAKTGFWGAIAFLLGKLPTISAASPSACTSLCFSVQTSVQAVMESGRNPFFIRASHEYAILLQHVRLLKGPVSSYNCVVIDKGVNTLTRHSGAHFTTTFEISRCDKGVGTLRHILSDWKRMTTPPTFKDRRNGNST